MTKSSSRYAYPVALFLAALTAACGGDVTLPEEGEAANLEIVDGDEQVGPAGAPLAQQVLVRVTDTQDRPVPNQEVAFVIESGGGSVTPGTVATNSTGHAAADWTLGPAAGDQRLRARTQQGGSSELLEVTFRATAIAGSGSVLVEVAGDEQTGPVNSALADSLVVQATDALGNPVPNVEVTWSVSGGGSISPATVLTGTDGLAAAERVLGPGSGAQSAQAAVEGFAGSPVTFTHTAVPANPTVLVMVSGDDQSAPGGFEVPNDLVVRLEDANGNGIGGRPITWVVPAGSGSVSPVNTTTNANGLAATRWTLPAPVGEYTVNAVFSGLPPVVFSGSATADVPTRIALVSGNNQTAAVGAALPNPLVVRVTDANNNPVAGVSVNWTAEDGGSVASATSGTDASGLAQMTRTLGTAIGTYRTTAAVDGLAGSPITFTSTATVGAPVRLAITVQPGSPTVSGEVFSPVPRVQVQDAFGNPVPAGGVTVTAAIVEGSGQPGATLTNEERNTGAGGLAIFNNLRITGAPDTDYRLIFTGSIGGVPLASATTDLLEVTAGGATRLVVVQQPSATVQNGAVFPQQPTVQVVDATGNPVTGSRTIEVDLGVGTGTLSGTLTASTGSGSTATFTGLRITGPVGTKSLIFSSGALTPVESASIELTAGPAESIEIAAGQDQTAGVGEAVGVDPAVRVEDVSGNPVAGVQVQFAVGASGGAVAPATVTTGSNGVATVESWTLGGTAGDYTLTATVSGVGSVTFNATASATSTSTTLTAEPTSTSTEGQQVTFTATVTNGGGTPTGEVIFRDNGAELGRGGLSGAGVATFQTSTLPVGSHSITAEYPGDGTFGPSTSDALAYTVEAANVPPTAQANTYSVEEEGTLSVAANGVLGNDSDGDGDALTAELVAGPANAEAFDLDPSGAFTYTPADNFTGDDTFTYRASDGQAVSNTAIVTITVTSVNDPPTVSAGSDVSTSSLLSSVLGASHEGWATGISPGPNESDQTVELEVTLDDPANAAAFQTPPQIDETTGTLTYRPSLRLDTIVIGVTVLARDSEGATSEPQTFRITINP
ncbi:MAG TPA: Ig-like domain-containing protein [Gemmatimonadales bacterium]|nr:Ig-like domain-containing protein [Gemmatimonadales bacterium]